MRGQRWTRGELAVCLSALVIAIVLGILHLANLVGSWVLILLGLMTTAVGLMRYPAETRGKGREPVASATLGGARGKPTGTTACIERSGSP